jgi:hypothetical protein
MARHANGSFPAMKYYYTNSANQPVGPVDRSELDRLADQGTIHAQTSVLPEGGQTWSTYAQLQQGAGGEVAAALATQVSSAAQAIRQFSWSGLAFGMLLSLVSWLTLPATVLSSAARELADWGRQKTLPTAASDLPVLTFLVIVLRNLTLVLFFTILVICSVLCLFGAGPLCKGRMLYGDSSWNAFFAFGGFVCGMLSAYFGQLVIAFWFELLSIGVRIANDVKGLAHR